MIAYAAAIAVSATACGGPLDTRLPFAPDVTSAGSGLSTGSAELLEPASGSLPGSDSTIVRSRVVRVRRELLGPETAPVNVGFSPFPDVALTLEFKHFDDSARRRMGWSRRWSVGRFDDVCPVERHHGREREESGDLWHLRSAADGTYVVEEINLARLPPD